MKLEASHALLQKKKRQQTRVILIEQLTSHVKEFRFCPVFISQTLTLLSKLPVTTHGCNGENSMHSTESVCASGILADG